MKGITTVIDVSEQNIDQRMYIQTQQNLIIILHQRENQNYWKNVKTVKFGINIMGRKKS